jgi:hypothetical protein
MLNARMRKLSGSVSCQASRFRLTLARVQANGSGSASKKRQLAYFILIYGFWFALVALSYHRTPVSFFRAESGWYQTLSRASPASQTDFVRHLFTKSHNGHYAPFVFWLEFQQTKFVGTREAYWRWRAILLISLLGSILFLLVRRAAVAAHLSTTAACCLSTGLTSLILFQPLMIEFVAWPFLVLQVCWMILSMIALWSLISLVSGANPQRFAWIAALSSYGSLHFSGLGLLAAAATASIFAAVLLLRDRFEWFSFSRRHLLAALALLVFLTVCHAICMLRLNSIPSVTATPAFQPLTRALMGFAGVYPLFILHAFFVVMVPLDVAGQLQSAWPFGPIVFLVGIFIIAVVVRPLKEGERKHAVAVRFVLISFSFIGYTALLLLLAIREIREPSPVPLLGMFTGPRDVVPSTIVFFGALVAATATWAAAGGKTAYLSIASLLLAFCTVISQHQFARYVYPKFQPLAQISHDHAWSLIKRMSREARAAGLPVPNVIMSDLTQEFRGWDLKLFEPVLCHDLKLAPEQRIEFIDIGEALGSRNREYARSVPSLAELSRTMRVR